VARRIDVPSHELLAWGIARCPLVADRTAAAVFPETTHVNADFSYTCRPYAGPGYFLVGDSAVFLDPIFSTGICLGMVGAIEASNNLVRVLHGRMSPGRARRRYVRVVRAGSDVFFRMVDLYYDHAFRELFLHGHGPLGVHRAVISILSGHVFPRPRFGLRWRTRLFELMVALQRRFRLVARRDGFSLVAPSPPPAVADETVQAAPAPATVVGAVR
jgi:2-polyprenyl-6-methoxyphenol hydroxylase-like FAD-dependent oxidoreductase